MVVMCDMVAVGVGVVGVVGVGVVAIVRVVGGGTYVVDDSCAAAVKTLPGGLVTPDENWDLAAISKQPILSRYWKPHLVKDGKLMETTMKDYGPDLLTNYIKDFIKDNAKSDQPFLAFYPMVLAHSSHCITPIEVAQGQKASNAHFRHGSPEGRAIFENQIRYMDKLVGDIVKTVEEKLGEKDVSSCFVIPYPQSCGEGKWQTELAVDIRAERSELWWQTVRSETMAKRARQDSTEPGMGSGV